MVEGASKSVVVATFTDTNPSPLNDYSATINWHDGTPLDTTSAVVSFSGSIYSITGTHSYAEETLSGTHNDVTVNISELNGSDQDTATTTSKASVADPSPITTGGFIFTDTEGLTSSVQTVATFTDPGGAESLGNYSASIWWDDGSTSAGTITFNSGTFTVSGSHRYAEEGNRGIRVTIHHDQAPDVVVFDTAKVADPAVALTGDNFKIRAFEGIDSGLQTVATFTDPGGPELSTDYSAQINWGDQSSSAGVVTFNSGTHVFTVQGSHTYAEENAYIITVTLHHDVAPDVIAIDSADMSVVGVGGFPVNATEGASSGSQTVATFTDPGGPEGLSNYSANIDWGDGFTSVGTISFNSTSGVFTVAGSHTYAEEGNPNITVTIHHATANDAVVTSNANVTDAPLTVQGTSFNSTEGSPFAGVVATFTDADPNGTTSEYSAVITWGDGNTSSGIIVAGPGNAFSVTGSHTYAEEGSQAVGVTVTDKGGSSNSTTSTATIGDAVLSGSPAFVQAQEGATFSGLVATFTDANAGATAGDFSAVINWGDGQMSNATLITANGSGGFDVVGSHSYSEEGNFSVQIQISDVGGKHTQVNSFALVSDAPLSAAGQGISPVEGTSFAGTVATFTDADPNGTVSDYHSTIIWGDGQVTVGTVQANSSGGFNVVGNHTYAEEGTYSIQTQISDVGGQSAAANSTASVSDPAVAPTGGFTLKAGETISTGTQTVATFTDPAGPEPVANYSATISWGDNSSSPGTITFNSGTAVFTISGSHTYAEQGTFAITVTVQHDQAPPATAGSSALIRVISDIAGRVQQSGDWWVAASNGSTSFTNSKWDNWNPNVTWVDVLAGDFNGDGRTDYVGRVLQTGEIWVALSNGSSFTSTLWTKWNPNVTWADVRVGDFTGKGKDDLVGRVVQTGEIWVATSTGSSFVNKKWDSWNPQATWVDTQVGDFNGDGKADYAARDLGTGAWWVGVSTGSSFNTSPVPWTMWNNQVTWVDVRVGDFTGDGMADIVGRVQQTGQIWVGQSTGTSFKNLLWTTWNAGVTWADVLVGDFTGDGKADLVGRVAQTNQIWVATSTGSSFTNSLWASWNPTATFGDLQVGDFNGDGKDDIAGLDLGTGAWWIGISNGSSVFTTLPPPWTFWNRDVTWVDVHCGDLA
jgi:hypothetical protein